jgi:hypothetical protein
MSPRTFISISAAAVIAVVLAIVLIFVKQASTDNPVEESGPMFPALAENLDDLGRIRIETARYELTLELKDQQWVAVDFGDYPVNPEPLLQIVASLAEMTKVEAKTDNPDWYGYVGVEDIGPASNSVRIVAETVDGTQLLDAIFGNASESIGFTRVGGTFVRPTDADRTWLVEGVIAAPNYVQDWFSPLLAVPGTDVAGVAIFIGDDELLAAEKVDFATADYELTYLDETIGPPETTANDAGFRSVTQGIVSTIFDQARALDTVTFGPESRTVRFTTRAGLQLDVRLGEADGEVWVAYAASAEAGSEAAATAAAINAKTERWAFRIPTYRVASLNQPIDALIVLPAPEAPPAPAPGPLIPLPPIAP